jgi:bifunctional ADP-heptose synthase (sugar kinase/adenylyltransferase)
MPPEAAEIANRVSGVVVGKLGTAKLSREEQLGVFEGSAATHKSASLGR